MDEALKSPYSIRLGKAMRWLYSKPAEHILNDGRLMEIDIKDKDKRSLMSNLILKKLIGTKSFKNWARVDDQQQIDVLKCVILCEDVATKTTLIQENYLQQCLKV